MPKDDNTTEVTVAVLQEQVKTLAAAVDKLEKDRDSAVRWGLVTLGTAVVGLITLVWENVQSLLKAAGAH